MKKLLKLLVASILTVITAVMLFACAPANLDKAENKLKNDGYTIVSSEEVNKDGVVGMVIAYKQDGIFDYEYIVAVLYENSTKATEAVNEIEEEFGSYGNVYQSGKWLIVGDEDAYEDFVE